MPYLQGKLLRALQENEFERVGDERTVKVDVRIVAATNRNLIDDVKQGLFREDLYYRLSVFPIEVPALRERKADITPLAQQFLNQFCQQLGREKLQLNQRHIDSLNHHDWPGNIRELKNVIERALILSPGNNLRLDLALPRSSKRNMDIEKATQANANYLTEAEFRLLEKANLVKALRKAEWKISGKAGAADLLGIKPSTLAYRMSIFGIEKNS